MSLGRLRTAARHLHSSGLAWPADGLRAACALCSSPAPRQQEPAGCSTLNEAGAGSACHSGPCRGDSSASTSQGPGSEVRVAPGCPSVLGPAGTRADSPVPETPRCCQAQRAATAGAAASRPAAPGGVALVAQPASCPPEQSPVAGRPGVRDLQAAPTAGAQAAAAARPAGGWWASLVCLCGSHCGWRPPTCACTLMSATLDASHSSS